jgi:hypothetical protein
MSDATNLRRKLASTDMTAMTIQSSAAAMLSFYDKPSGPQTAVSEWRNILQSARNSQLLPLLYIANEVLQTSKRNRGNKFLEAFGPVLGNSLKFICERDPALIEKVRRTVKIWGDRAVFSTRFVGEILTGLEAFRHRESGSNAAKPSASSVAATLPSTKTTTHSTPASEESDMFENSDDNNDDEGVNRNIETGLQNTDSIFGASSGPSLLDVSNFSIAAASSTSKFGSNKRRRESEKAKSPKKRKLTQKKSKSALSTSNFVELISQLCELDDRYNAIQSTIASIESSDILSDEDKEIVQVGDELIRLHTSVNSMKSNLIHNKASLWNIANTKHEIEMQLKKYLVWLKGGLNADMDELKLCDALEEKLLQLQVVHTDAKALRDATREHQEKERLEAEEAARKEAEEKELRKSLEKIQKDKAPKEGMVWNKVAREYQYLDTSENWRD